MIHVLRKNLLFCYRDNRTEKIVDSLQTHCFLLAAKRGEDRKVLPCFFAISNTRYFSTRIEFANMFYKTIAAKKIVQVHRCYPIHLLQIWCNTEQICERAKDRSGCSVIENLWALLALNAKTFWTKQNLSTEYIKRSCLCRGYTHQSLKSTVIELLMFVVR